MQICATDVLKGARIGRRGPFQVRAALVGRQQPTGLIMLEQIPGHRLGTGKAVRHLRQLIVRLKTIGRIGPVGAGDARAARQTVIGQGRGVRPEGDDRGPVQRIKGIGRLEPARPGQPRAIAVQVVAVAGGGDKLACNGAIFPPCNKYFRIEASGDLILLVYEPRSIIKKQSIFRCKFEL